MSLKKQVIICTDGIFPNSVGGMQRHSRLLIENLAQNNDWDIVVIHPHSERLFSNYSSVSEEHINGIDTKKNYLSQCYNYSKRVHEVLLRYPNAIIYSQGLSVWYKQKEFSSRLIVNPHGLEPFQSIGLKDRIIASVFKAIFIKIFKRSDKVISLGGRLTTILKKYLPSNKIAVIPNGVEPRTIVNRDFDKLPFNMLFVARFAHNKGIRILMEAIQQLNKSGLEKTFIFHLAGKGPLYEKYLKENKQTNIVFHGFVSDEKLELLYKESHAFVFPTLFEGMPTVILEAMANRLPIISTDTGAIAELVDSSNGWLIQKNSIDELVDALIKFAACSSSQKMEMGINSRNKIETEFNWKIVTKMHIELFESVRN